MNMRAIFLMCGAMSLGWTLPLTAGSASDISPAAVYDLSPSYLAVGLSVAPVGITNAVQVAADNSGDGGESVKLGGVGLLADGQMAGIEWPVTGSGVLAFDWKVSSEAEWDWLRFYEVGGAATNRISGSTGGWSRVYATINGASDAVHTFRWEYEKDPYGDFVGSDCGWVDAASWSPFFALTVDGGAGDGAYTNGTVVTIIADAPPLYFTFDHWTGNTNGVADVFAPSTALVMLGSATVVTATYKPILYPITVNSGTGSGAYTNGATVTITADAPPADQKFDRWVGDTNSVANIFASPTVLSMPATPVTVSATYVSMLHSLTVINGSEGGVRREGSTVSISADPDPLWKEFAVWTGDGAGLLADASARTTSFTMPMGTVTLTATYRDSIARVAGCYGRTLTVAGTADSVTVDAAAGSPSATPAVKLGGAGVVPDNGFAAFETAVSGSGTVTFWWKVSSEGSADYLKFIVDSVQVYAISGTTGPWAQITNRVEGAGAHALRWEYAKNGSNASSTDAGWVDDIVWTGDAPEPVISPDIHAVAAAGGLFGISFLGERGIPYTVYSNATLDASGWAPMAVVPQEQGETNGVFRFLAAVVPDAGQPSCFYRMFGGAQPDMVRVQGGSLPDIGNGAITVSSFFIGKYEVTWAEWQTVRDWAAANGYDIGNFGAGSASNHPVQMVNWYNCVKWCNARSQKEGRTPVYYTDAGFTLVYKAEVLEPYVNAAADGYRLPTDAEWEFAARGGTRSLGYEYSGGNDLNAAGWCWDNSWGAAVDLYEGRGTWPIGTKAANELGLFGMSGNVWEWCQDWLPGCEGWYRVKRGGGWTSDAGACRSACLASLVPSDRWGDVGFRAARTLP